MPDWLNTGLMIISSFTGRSCLRKVSGAAFPRANVSAGVSAKSCGSWLSSPASCSSSPAVSARFPRGLPARPRRRWGQDVPQGTLYAPAQNRRNRPPNGLQGPRSSRAGWSVRSWPAAGWWAPAFVLRFQPGPRYRYTVVRLTPRSLEISAALTSLSRSSWLAQAPVTADLAPAWSTAVTVPCTLTTAPVSTEWRSTAARVPAVRPPESSGLSMMKRDPIWVIWVI